MKISPALIAITSLLSISVSAANIPEGTLACTSELAIESVIDGYQTGNTRKINAFIGDCSVFEVPFDVDVIEWGCFSSYSSVRIYDDFGHSDWWVTTNQIIVN